MYWGFRSKKSGWGGVRGGCMWSPRTIALRAEGEQREGAPSATGEGPGRDAGTEPGVPIAFKNHSSFLFPANPTR